MIQLKMKTIEKLRYLIIHSWLLKNIHIFIHLHFISSTTVYKHCIIAQKVYVKFLRGSDYIIMMILVDELDLCNRRKTCIHSSLTARNQNGFRLTYERFLSLDSTQKQLFYDENRKIGWLSLGCLNIQVNFILASSSSNKG